MTYEEMENFTYAELENFTYYDLSTEKLELLQKVKDNSEIPDSIKQKLSELCYEALHSYDPAKFKELNIPNKESKYTIGELIQFFKAIQRKAELAKLFLPYTSDLFALVLELYNQLTF